MNTIIITGGNRGIGFECAMQMAKLAKNEQIIITSRDMTSGNEAAEKIKQKTSHTNISAITIDLASLASIRQFKDDFVRAKYGNISVLVNNAGLQNVGEMAYTKDGFEETFGVNQLGPFYLTLLLLPYLTEDARITFTASGTHDPLKKTGVPDATYTNANQLAHPEKIIEEKFKAGQRRYATSKLCTVMTVYQLQNHLNNTNINVNAFAPGLVPGTGLARNYPPFYRFVSNYIFKFLMLFNPKMVSVEKAGANLANLAYAPDYKQFKGKYFEGKKEIPSSEDSYNPAYQKDLWNTSIRLTNIKQADTSLQLA